MGRLIGEAYIALLPDSHLLRPEATAQVKRALTGVKGTIPIKGDTSDVDKAIARVAAGLRGLDGDVNLNMRGAIADVASLRTALEALRARAGDIPVDMDDSKGLAKLYALLAGADDLGKKLEDLGDADLDINRALAKFYTLETGVKALDKAASHMRADFDEAVANGKLLELNSGVKKISDALSGMRADVADSGYLAKIVAMQAQALKLAKTLQDMPITADTLPFEADMFKLAAQVEALKKVMDVPAEFGGSVYKPTGAPRFANQSETGQLDPLRTSLEDIAAKAYAARSADLAFLSTTRDMGPVATMAAAGLRKISDTQGMIVSSGAGGWWGGFTNQIRLFGGALDHVLPKFMTSISVWHLAADLIFEFAAAWVPALIAVGTFAAYAFPVGEKIYGQWKNINTILDGVGGKLPDLGSSFDTIQRAIEPSILEAFGEYMMVIGRNAAPLGAALAKVGQVVDVWGAGFVAWAGKAQKSFDGIVSVGAKDFAAIGYGFQQVFRILGSLFRDMPGYVHILLLVGDAFLHVTANVVQFLSPIIRAGLYLHGFMVYVGLAVTGILALSRAVAGGAIAGFLATTGGAVAGAGKEAETAGGKFNRFGTAIGNFGGVLAGGLVSTFKYGKGLLSLGREGGVAKAGTKLFGDALGLIGGPIGAATLGIGALAVGIGVALYFAMRNSADAASQLGTKMEGLITSSNIVSIQHNIATAIETTTAALHAQGDRLEMLAKSPYSRGLGVEARQQLGEYTSQVGLYATQAGNYGQRLAQLSKIFGSTGAAEGGLALAGVSAGKVATDNNKTWAETLIQLTGLAKGYGYMGQQTGQAGKQLDTLSIASGTILKNIQTLTQAESAWITLISGGDSAFTSFEQGQATLGAAMAKGAKSGATLRVTLGNLHTTYPLVGTALNGVTQSALAARQAFDAQLGAGVTLYGNLQQLAGASGHTASAQLALFKSGKDIVAQLLPMAAGSKEATAQVYALAQVAGYTGPDSFKSLVRWVGNTKTAEADLNNQQAKLTISSANLTIAAKNLGNALNTEVTQAQAAAISKTANLTGATLNLANAANAAHGQVTQTAMTFAGEYVASLTKAGVGTNQAKEFLNAYLKQLGYSQAAIITMDSQLGSSVGSWTKYGQAVQHNTQAAKDNAKAIAQNYQAFQGLYGILPGSAAQLDKVWAALVKQDVAMISSGKDAAGAKQQFADFAQNGLDLTKSQADKLWAKFGQQNLDTLAAKAADTKNRFIDFAENGLHLTQERANALWGEFVQQNLDMLAAKGNNAKNKFIDLARNGLDLTASQANTLWGTLRRQYLDTLAAKAGETRGAFEKTAAQFGITRQAADKLYTSMHKLAAGSPYNARENTIFSGSGSVTARANIPGQPNLTSHLNFLGPGHATGGIIPGASSNGHDNYLATVKSGELIIPSQHAPRFANMAKSAGIPGFTQGGLVPGEISGINNVTPFSVNTSTQFAQEVGKAYVKGLTTAVNQQAMSAMTGGSNFSGAVPGGFGNLLVIARYLMANGLNKAAAAGMAATIYGESGGSPESVGSGGFGLIGWTGNTIGLPPGYHGPTGNIEFDMAAQLRGVIGYMNSRGGAGPLNAAGNPVLAGDVWSRYEAPLVPLSDTRPSIANEVFAMLSSGSSGAAKAISTQNRVNAKAGQKPHSAGGMVSEPVYGTGAYTGMPYSFAENGQPEYVGPLSGKHGSTPAMQPMTTYQGQNVVAALNMLVTLWKQFPQALGHAMSQGSGSGVRHGFYGAQY